MSQLVKQIKPIFEKVIEPVIHMFHKLNISPNVLTVLGLVITFFAFYLIVLGHFFSAGIVLTLGSIFDIFDGALARKFDKKSKFGAFLDSVVDRYSDFLPLAGIAFVFKDEPFVFFASLFTIAGSFLVSYTRARAEGLGIECNVGFFERPERLIILIAGLLTGFVETAVVILLIGSHLTAFQRIYHVYKVTKD